MKIAQKIILSILMVMLVLNIIYIPKIFAISDIISDANDFLNKGEKEELPIKEENVKSTSSKIYNILLACGIGVAVVVGAILGITFILSSVEGKAKIQEALIPYVVGCFIVFGAFGIWEIFINLGTDITKDKYQESLIKVEECLPNGGHQTPAMAMREILKADIDVADLSDNAIWILNAYYEGYTTGTDDGDLAELLNELRNEYEKRFAQKNESNTSREEKEDDDSGVHQSSSGRVHGGGITF